MVLNGETHHFDQDTERMENFIWGWMNELDDSEVVNGECAQMTKKKVIPLSVISEAIEENYG